jgi:hypothetical protein
MKTGCKRWKIKVNEDKIQAIYLSHRLWSAWAHPTLNGWNIPVVNHVNYLGVIANKRITWRLHIEHLLESTPYSKVSI